MSWLVEVVAHWILGIDVIREGTQLFDPSGTYQYEVAAACSGMRSLIAIFLLATIYGFITFRSPWKRLFLMALAFPLAVLGNLARMLFIIMAAEIGGQEAGNYVHEGGIFSLVPLHSGDYRAAGRRAADGKTVGFRRTSGARTSMKHQKWLILFVALALMAGTAGALTWLRANQKLGKPGIKATPIPGSVMMKIDLPERVLDFTSTNVPESEVVLNYLPKDTSYVERHYQAPDGFGPAATIILMGADRTSIHRPDYCLPGQGWTIDSKTAVTIPISGGHPYELPVMKWVIHNSFQTPDGQKQEVSGIYVFWFVADHEQTTDNFQRMWWLARDLVAHGRVATLGLRFVFFHLCAGPGGRDV